MPFEDDLGWEYFGNDPMNSLRMTEHMDWHNDPQNKNRTGNYGERFFDFHQQYIAKFDTFRATKGLIPVSSWDPATPIPAALAHSKTLTAGRYTDNPSSVDPHCRTPTWATLAGGTDPAPIYGYTNLSQFHSLDELGRAVDSGWHGKVHNTIGGDMREFHSPIDPVFWRWHRWIDDVRAAWELGQKWLARREVMSLVHILFGVVNDAPGVVIPPGGRPRPVPGGPGDPMFEVSPALREVLSGHLVQGLAVLVEHEEARQTLRELGAKLTKTKAVR